MDSKLNIM